MDLAKMANRPKEQSRTTFCRYLYKVDDQVDKDICDPTDTDGNTVDEWGYETSLDPRRRYNRILKEDSRDHDVDQVRDELYHNDANRYWASDHG